MTERQKSWVDSAQDPEGDFPIDNIPFGVFEGSTGDGGRVGTAIGDRVVEVATWGVPSRGTG